MKTVERWYTESTPLLILKHLPSWHPMVAPSRQPNAYLRLSPSSGVFLQGGAVGRRGGAGGWGWSGGLPVADGQRVARSAAVPLLPLSAAHPRRSGLGAVRNRCGKRGICAECTLNTRGRSLPGVRRIRQPANRWTVNVLLLGCFDMCIHRVTRSIWFDISEQSLNALTLSRVLNCGVFIAFAVNGWHFQ